MTVRLIREADIQELVDIHAAIQAVERAFLEQGQGSGVNEPRRRVRQPHGVLHSMAASLGGRGYWGIKVYTTTSAGARFLVHLYDTREGRLLAILEANRLGQLRTGAASGVATRLLAPEQAEVLAMFGTGYQAETQLEAIAAVRSLAVVRVFSRTPEKRALFADRMGSRLGLDIVPVNQPAEAVVGADIVTTITNARAPVFSGDDLGDGVHINAAGSNAAVRAELDRKAVRRADRIFTDDLQQARLESGDLIQAFEGNALNWGRVRPLADVVAGLTVGRQTPEEVTLFESQGIALWDIALAADVYEKAVADNVGETMEFAA